MGPFLPTVGSNLKARRLAYGRVTGGSETLKRAACRLGIDPKTLREMERGSLAVSLGKYFQAAQIYGGTEGFEQLYLEQPSENAGSNETDLFAGWPKK